MRDMFGSISRHYDLLNDVLSLGIHRLWRQKLFDAVAQNRHEVILDLCTGTGALLPSLAGAAENLIGADICAPMIEHGLKKLSQDVLDQVKFVLADVDALPFRAKCIDAVTIAFGVRNFRNPEEALREIHRVLQTSGRVYILELGRPAGAFTALLFSFYARFLLPFVGGLISGNRGAYSYLKTSALSFPSGSEFGAIMKRAGFAVEKIRALSSGIAWLYIGTVSD